jgi:hypothetical protein
MQPPRLRDRAGHFHANSLLTVRRRCAGQAFLFVDI